MAYGALSINKKLKFAFILALFISSSFDAYSKVSIAIITHIDNYLPATGFRALPHTINDAEELAKILSKTGYKLYRDNIISNSDVNKENLYKIINELQNEYPNGIESILVYFSGHGFSVDNSNYLATWGVNEASIETLGLSLDEFSNALNAIDADRKIMIIDACRSPPNGKKGTGREFSPHVNINLDSLNRIPAGNGFLYMLSTADNGYSWESDDLGKGHGVFSYFLIKGIQENIGADRGYNNADNLFEYVSSAVSAWSKQNGKVQSPYKGGEYGANFKFSELCQNCSELIYIKKKTPVQTAEAILDLVDSYNGALAYIRYGSSSLNSNISLSEFSENSLRYVAKRKHKIFSRRCLGVRGAEYVEGKIVVACSIYTGDEYQGTPEYLMMTKTNNKWLMSDYYYDVDSSNEIPFIEEKDLVNAAKKIGEYIDNKEFDKVFNQYVHGGRQKGEHKRLTTTISKKTNIPLILYYLANHDRVASSRDCSVSNFLEQVEVECKLCSGNPELGYIERYYFRSAGQQNYSLVNMQLLKYELF